MSETTIATGIYTIENVDRHNDIVLADDKSGTLVAGSSAVDADPPLKACWMITRLRNRRYTISPAANHNKFASWPSSVQLGGAIVTSPDANDWVVSETSKKGTFVISHFHHQLYWCFEDGAQGSPVTLRDKPTGFGNQWKFLPCLGPTLDARKSAIESPPFVRSGKAESNPIQRRNRNDDRPAIRHVLRGHTNWVRSVAYSLDGTQIASGSWDRTICVWDVRTKHLAFETIKGHTDPILSVAFSPDGQQIVSGSADRTVRIWDAQSGTLSRTLNGHTDWVRSVACSPDGKRVVSGSQDKNVRVWDVETGSLVLGPLFGHTNQVNAVNFSKDGKHILSGSWDLTVRVWDAETGHAIRTFCGQSAIWSATFSPDSKQIVSGDQGGVVAVWDMQSGDSITLRGHKCQVYSVAFSPDGGRIVSGGWDGQIMVWDSKLGKAIGRLEGHTDTVLSVAFSPDGKWIVSGCHDKTVRIWEADRLDAMPDRT